MGPIDEKVRHKSLFACRSSSTSVTYTSNIHPVQKIKKDLIHKAKLKKDYAKLKAREQPSTQRSVYDHENSEPESTASPAPEPTLEPHPDRQKLLGQTSASPEPRPDRTEPHQGRKRSRPKTQPFKAESSFAQKRKEEAEARRKAHEEAEKERQRRIAERERFRKTMAKARGGPNGQRKLGKESTVLLEKVRRMVGSV